MILMIPGVFNEFTSEVALILVDAFLFFLTVKLLEEQLKLICSNPSNEMWKCARHGEAVGHESKWSKMESVFGEKFSWRWFYPSRDPTIAKEE